MESLGKLTLYSYRRCPFAIRARMTLEEKRIQYTKIEENLAELSPELLSMHPEGRVPLLVHETPNGKHVIYQSTIITEYLDELFPENKLMPNDPVSRMKIRLWTYWCDQIFKPDLDTFKYELKNLSENDSAALQNRLHGYFTEWNLTLKESSYMVGDEMTLADIHLFPFARQFSAIKPGLSGSEKYSHLSAWLAKMVSRPTFERVMK